MTDTRPDEQDAEKSEALTNLDDLDLRNPRVGAASLIELSMGGKERSKALASKVSNKLNVSNQTVYQTLDELTKNGLVDKEKRSDRNVQYRLTPRGEDLVHLHLAESRGSIFRGIEAHPNSWEVALEAIARIACQRFLADWNSEEARTLVRDHLERSIEQEVEGLKVVFENKDEIPKKRNIPR